MKTLTIRRLVSLITFSAKIVLLIILGLVSQEVMAENSRRAVDHAFKALGKNEEVKAVLKEKKEKAQIQLDKLKDAIGENSNVVIALGVVAKVALDGKIGHKVKVGQNSTYSLNVNISGEFTTGFSGSVDVFKNSSYNVVAHSKGSDQGLKMGLKFNFD